MNANWISAGIPQNWQVKKLRYICSSIKTGSTPSAHLIEADSTPESVRWFTPVDFAESIYLNTSKRSIRDEAIVEGEAEIFPEKSVYAVGIGSIGKVGLCEVEASANQQLNVLTPNKSTDARFLAYSLLNQADLLLAFANSSTLPILNQQRMGDVHIALPSFSTQRAIADYLDRETARLDALVAAKEQLLGLLAEKRQALIAFAIFLASILVSSFATPASPGSGRFRHTGQLNVPGGYFTSGMSGPLPTRRNCSRSLILPE